VIALADAHTKAKKQWAGLNNQDIPIVPLLEHVSWTDEVYMSQIEIGRHNGRQHGRHPVAARQPGTRRSNLNR
jgi:hypothetical protein